MNLSTALRYKNRVIARLQSAEELVRKNNTIPVTSERVDNFLQHVKDLTGLRTHLINVKMAIEKATLPIKDLILQVAENKGLIQFYSEINVFRGGLIFSHRDDDKVEMKSHISESQVIDLVRALETLNEKLQEKIDAHNATVSVDIENILDK